MLLKLLTWAQWSNWWDTTTSPWILCPNVHAILHSGLMPQNITGVKISFLCSGENAISARNDLNPRNGSYPFGALGHRYCHKLQRSLDQKIVDNCCRSHGGTDMKVTSYKLAQNLQFIAQSGPTWNPLPPFQWSKQGINHWLIKSPSIFILNIERFPWHSPHWPPWHLAVWTNHSCLENRCYQWQNIVLKYYFVSKITRIFLINTSLYKIFRTSKNIFTSLRRRDERRHHSNWRPEQTETH